MSNFICSECGIVQIDCDGDGYKTPKEIELEKKVHILNEANMKLENMVGKLYEQLKEANKLIKDFHEMHEFNKSAIEYLEKWSVK